MVNVLIRPINFILQLWECLPYTVAALAEFSLCVWLVSFLYSLFKGWIK